MEEEFDRDQEAIGHKVPLHHTYSCDVAGHHFQLDVADELSSHGELKFEDHAMLVDPAKAIDPNYVLRRGRSFR